MCIRRLAALITDEEMRTVIEGAAVHHHGTREAVQRVVFLSLSAAHRARRG